MSNNGRCDPEHVPQGNRMPPTLLPPMQRHSSREPVREPVIDVEQLLQGGSEVRLDHRGVQYRLRVTRQGKLLLTK